MEEKMVALSEEATKVLLVREKLDSVHDVVILFKVKRFEVPLYSSGMATMVASGSLQHLHLQLTDGLGRPATAG